MRQPTPNTSGHRYLHMDAFGVHRRFPKPIQRALAAVRAQENNFICSAASGLICVVPTRMYVPTCLCLFLTHDESYLYLHAYDASQAMSEMKKKPGDTVPSLVSAAHYGTIGVRKEEEEEEYIRRGLNCAHGACCCCLHI